MLGTDEGIKLVFPGGKVLGTILRNIEGITLGVDVGTKLISLDGYFNVSNDGKL